MCAEILFKGGRVFTPGGFAEAVLVRDGRIAAVGREADLVRLAPGAEPVDLAGGLLTPGFVDAHIHPVQAGLERAKCDLSGVFGLDAYLTKIAEYAAAHPDREWIDGGGWDMSAFPGGLPHRTQLDFLDRPVYLVQRDHHAAWVNTRALELAGITKDTPDPADGRIERDPDGTPSGVLHEGAMDLVGLLTPRPTAADLDAALMDAQSHLFSLGITGWQDAIVGSYAGSDDQLPVYLSAAESGRLKARVVGALWWDRTRGAEQIPELVERRARADGLPRFRATAVKIMQDGIPENFTAAVIEPYCGCGGTGLSYVDPELLPGYVKELDALGFQVHFHAIGERAVREALDALSGTDPANRHHIAHVQIIHPEDVPRFARIGVTANIQPLWATHHAQMDELCIPYLGPERARWQYPFADLVRHGTRLAAGSDWPVSSADPLQGMHVAVNRTEPGGSVHASYPTAQTPFLPEQRIDLRTILTAYTAGSAWVNGSPAGVIEPGRPADLVVLDRDPFALEPGEIWTTRVRMTFLDGECVYHA
ncbi:amidohydrolase [Thermobispora bispora]|uniref:Amidohydrolase 3 n=1 Tax=Thermobispora bispora (strain ATCC 19993 / DSM 43833 / CBS 139.67 / JCM 10125 / KCTC 9307 / NBRC 14880 / R51) TaxID=469371 RepID=D6Y1U4_THEBD|nr:amidohydrolase [Thermobispora bispora]MBO2474564.1 amidohydrolase [Actinomycetales bacterium]MDI9580685.1 amidohydrolase [Thermobispora sp.]ADG88700.1 Amidohydrolase 3 [Thermobispora bispora DSM 43833]MBX6166987.1 amidohydrolase [Thermobispora bispora]QSI48478.1 amidohydrolase [Thermobispora bispora]